MDTLPNYRLLLQIKEGQKRKVCWYVCGMNIFLAQIDKNSADVHVLFIFIILHSCLEFYYIKSHIFEAFKYLPSSLLKYVIYFSPFKKKKKKTIYL